MKPASFAHLVILVLVIGVLQPALADFDISEEKRAVIEQVDALEQEIEKMSMELWNYSEIALPSSRRSPAAANGSMAS